METENVKTDTSALVQEVLDAAKKSEVVNHDAAKESAAKDTSDTKETKTNTKAAERIQELVAERNKAMEALLALQTENKEFKSSYGELASLVESIRDLAVHEDDAVKNAVILVDKALKGEYKGPTVSGPKEQQASEKESMLLSKVEKLEKEVNSKLEQSSQEILLSNYQNSAIKALDTLPEEYTVKDKERLAKSFADFVDWDAVQKEPLKVDSYVQSALSKVLEDYGDPIGRVQAQIRKEFEDKKPAAAKLTPKEQMGKLLDVPWDKADEKGNPQMSDKDFVKALAAAYKHDRSNL
jgi:hypothetical protein